MVPEMRSIGFSTWFPSWEHSRLEISQLSSLFFTRKGKRLYGKRLVFGVRSSRYGVQFSRLITIGRSGISIHSTAKCPRQSPSKRKIGRTRRHIQRLYNVRLPIDIRQFGVAELMRSAKISALDCEAEFIHAFRCGHVRVGGGAAFFRREQFGLISVD